VTFTDHKPVVAYFQMAVREEQKKQNKQSAFVNYLEGQLTSVPVEQFITRRNSRIISFEDEDEDQDEDINDEFNFMQLD